MRAILKYAVHTPDRWHDIGKGRGAKMAIRRLAKAGHWQVRPEFNRFRVKHELPADLAAPSPGPCPVLE